MNRKTRRALKAQGVSMVDQADPKKALEQEYYTKCAAMGELAYRMSLMQEELNKLTADLKDLNQRYHAINTPAQEPKDVSAEQA